MPSFTVLLIKEHVQDDIELLDNRIIILYDKNEGLFYYYGTRNREDETKYIDYNGIYSYYQGNAFVNFLVYLLGNLNEVLTTELHQIDINKNEYDSLDFNELNEKISITSRKTLLSAYDRSNENETTIRNYLDMLVPFVPNY